METEFSSKDILCGRGGKTNTHCGNRIFRRMVNARKGLYRKHANDKRLKFLLVKSIYLATRVSGMRFINQSSLEEIDEKEAMEKVAQALRDARTGGNEREPSTYLPREESSDRYKDIYDRHKGQKADFVSKQRGNVRSSRALQATQITPHLKDTPQEVRRITSSCAPRSSPVVCQPCILHDHLCGTFDAESLAFPHELEDNILLSGNRTRSVLNVLSLEEVESMPGEAVRIGRSVVVSPDSIQSIKASTKFQETNDKELELRATGNEQWPENLVKLTKCSDDARLLLGEDYCCEDKFANCFYSTAMPLRSEENEHSCPFEQHHLPSTVHQQEQQFNIESIQCTLAHIQQAIEEQERTFRPILPRYPTSILGDELSSCWDSSVEEELCCI